MVKAGLLWAYRTDRQEGGGTGVAVAGAAAALPGAGCGVTSSETATGAALMGTYVGTTVGAGSGVGWETHSRALSNGLAPGGFQPVCVESIDRLQGLVDSLPFLRSSNREVILSRP